MSREQVDLDLIKRVYTSYDYESRFSAEFINMLIISGYYDKIIRRDNPLSIISTDKYISYGKKFAEGIKIGANIHTEIIKIFREQDEDGKVLIRTRI